MKKWALIIAVVLVWQYWDDIERTINPPQLPDVAAGEVVMYSTDWCGYCKKLKTFLRKNDIPFTELNIERNSEARRQYSELGGRGVPLSVVNGEVISGYNTRAILNAL